MRFTAMQNLYVNFYGCLSVNRFHFRFTYICNCSSFSSFAIYWTS